MPEISKGPLHNEKDTKRSHTKDTVFKKKRLFKIWQETHTEKDREDYEEAKKTASRPVVIEKDKAESDLYKQ